MTHRPKRPSLLSVLVVAIGGVAVAAVALTAVLTFGLTRLGSERAALAELDRDAERLASLAGDLPCRRRERDVRLPRELRAANARFVPEGRSAPILASLDGDRGRATLRGRPMLYVARAAVLCGQPGTMYVLRPASDPVPAEGLGGRLVLAGLGAFGISALAALLLGRRLSLPLTHLAERARRLPALRADEAHRSSQRDPAELVALREAFEEMSQGLRAAREREKAFLLSVSHELKTPLTAIRGYGEALADGTARTARQAGEVVVRQAQRLERLVGDLIDLARLEAGEFSVELEDVSLEALARGVVDAMRPAAGDAGIRLELRSSEPATVNTDPDRVQQMLANLVENALRTTPEGGRVTVSVTGTTLEVADSGPGLDSDDLDHVFERFYLWRRYRGERPVGTGLGLAITAELARLLGARADVASEPGAGTRFMIRFDT